MEKLEKLGEWPSDEVIKKMLIVSIIINVIIYPAMLIPGYLSGFPANQMISSQLCFSGPFLKAIYAQLTNPLMYTIAQSLDYIFMVGYGLLIFNLALFIGRKFDEGTFWRKSGYVVALFGIAAPSCDAVENAFILLTLTDITNFPNEWAVIHSVFALIKWILLMGALFWAIVAAIVNKVKN